MVACGSRTTRSPEGRVFRMGRLTGLWSQMSGPRAGFCRLAEYVERSRVTYDATGGERQQDDEDDERREGVTRSDDGRDGRDDEQEVRHDTDDGTDPEHLEPTVLGVGKETTEDGDQVRHELEHVVDGRRSDRTHAESTSGLVLACRTGGDSAGTVTADGETASDEVGEDVLASVVRGTLAKLDEAHSDGRPADGGGDPACQCLP